MSDIDLNEFQKTLLLNENFMTIEKARQLFPKETKSMTDKKLQQYCLCSEILSDMFINSLKRGKETQLDNNQTKN